MTRSNQVSDKKYREGYVDGTVNQQRLHSNGTGIGIIIGILLVTVLGVGTWLLLSLGQDSNSPSSETINVPDIDINLSTPEIEGPDVELPDIEFPASQDNPDASSDN